MDNEPSELDALLGLLRQASETDAGWYTLAIVAVVVGIRAYRIPAIQSMMPAVAQWGRLPFTLRIGIVFAVAAGASLAAGLLAGKTILAAMLSAVTVGIGAIVAHKTTKAIGHVQTQRAVDRKGLGYRPGSIRIALDPVFPLDRHELDGAAVLREAAERAEKESA